jgi:hypothetical protein
VDNNTIDFFGQQLNIITGEVHRQIDEFDQQSAYYIALAECMGHYVLFCYTDIHDYNNNYIAEIIDGTPSFASNYLVDTMQHNDNLLIYITRYRDADSCYDIYYDFNGDDLSIDGLVNWMQINNDFAAVNYRYTEIKDGKQTIPN